MTNPKKMKGVTLIKLVYGTAFNTRAKVVYWQNLLLQTPVKLFWQQIYYLNFARVGSFHMQDSGIIKLHEFLHYLLFWPLANPARVFFELHQG